MKLYETLARDIEDLIRRGVFRQGERVPSVRKTSQHHRLSITTVIHAYLLLESKGIIESRPQSGYFVRAGKRGANGTNNVTGASGKPVPELRASRPIAVSAQVDVSRLVLSTLRSIGTDDAIRSARLTRTRSCSRSARSTVMRMQSPVARPSGA